MYFAPVFLYHACYMAEVLERFINATLAWKIYYLTSDYSSAVAFFVSEQGGAPKAVLR